MSIAKELLQDEIDNLFLSEKYRLSLDVNDVVQTKALQCLSEIQEILKNERLSDFGAIEDIVCTFEKYGLDAGIRHDFG